MRCVGVCVLLCCQIHCIQMVTEEQARVLGFGLRWENRAGTSPGVRVPGLEIPWNPATNLALGPNDSNLF